MSEIYEDSDVMTPLIFLLSTGADPTSLLINFARARSINLKSISLGQG